MRPRAGDKVKISHWGSRVDKDFFYVAVSVFVGKSDGDHYCLVAFPNKNWYEIGEMGPNLPYIDRALGETYSKQHPDASFALVGVDYIVEIKGYRSNVKD